ncbi:MAG: hypothetical protein Q4P71_08215 [Actinomycetaceae bacterium]|nr:hypothetical protein [Actinomycetaceae bacterium]
MAHGTMRKRRTSARVAKRRQHVRDLFLRLVGTILISALFGFGTWFAIQRTVLPGYVANSVEVISEDEAYDADALVKSLERVRWGREVDLFIYIGPEADRRDDEDELFNRGISRIRPVAPQYFTSRQVLRAGVVGIWINPSSGETIVAKEPDTILSADGEYGQSLIQEPLLRGALSADDIVRAVDELALADGAVILHDIPTHAVAAGQLIAVAVAPIAWILLRSLAQYWRFRSRCPELASTSRRERKELVKSVKDKFGQTSTKIDDRALEISACQLPTYQSQLENRFDTWLDYYTNLSELWFDTYGHSDSWLAAHAQMPTLWAIKKQTDTVSGAFDVLVEDMAACAKPDDFRPRHSTSAHQLQAAIDSARLLSIEMSTHTEPLTRQIDRWERVLQSSLSSVGSVAEVERILRLWDALAIDMSQQLDQVLAAFKAEHGKRFSGQADIEKPAIFRAVASSEKVEEIIELSPSDARDLEVSGSVQGKMHKHDRAGALPYSSRFVAFALTIALLTGAGVSLTGFIVGGKKMGFDPFYPAPTDLANSEAETHTLLSEYAGEDSDTLIHPTSVSIEDEAGVLEHPEALKNHLENLGFAIPLNVKVLSSDQQQFETHDDGSRTERSLAEIFPRHLKEKPCDPATLDCSDPNGYWKYDADAVEPIDDNTLIVWMTGGAECTRITCGMIRGYVQTEKQEGLKYSLYSDETLLNTKVSRDVAIWNALVSATYETRNIKMIPDRPEPVASGTYVARGIFWAVIVGFVLFLVGWPYSIIRNRRSKASEVSSTLTGLSLTMDSRELDMLRAQMSHPSYSNVLVKRWTKWKNEFDEVVELCGFGTGNPRANLDDQVLSVRFLRVQAQSLRRTLRILDSQDARVKHWDDEVSVLYATEFAHLDYEDAVAIHTISRKFLAGVKKPAESILELDAIAARYRGAARVRCLDFVQPVDESLSDFLHSDVDVHLLTSSDGQGDQVLDSRYHLSSLVQRSPAAFAVIAVVCALAVTYQFVHILRHINPQTVELWQSEIVLDEPRYGVREVLIEDLGDHFDDAAVEAAIRSATYAFPTNVLITGAKEDPNGVYAPFINGYDYLDFIQGSFINETSEKLPATPRSLVIRIADRVYVNAYAYATINPEVLAKLEAITVDGDITDQLVDAFTTDQPILTMQIPTYERE